MERAMYVASLSRWHSRNASPALITDSIAPRLLPDLEVLSYRKTQVIAVQVHPSDLRPAWTWAPFASAPPTAVRRLR
jgi:hypothetical protein